jgi:hypothetical protein
MLPSLREVMTLSVAEGAGAGGDGAVSGGGRGCGGRGRCQWQRVWGRQAMTLSVAGGAAANRAGHAARWPTWQQGVSASSRTTSAEPDGGEAGRRAGGIAAGVGGACDRGGRRWLTCALGAHCQLPNQRCRAHDGHTASTRLRHGTRGSPVASPVARDTRWTGRASLTQERLLQLRVRDRLLAVAMLLPQRRQQRLRVNCAPAGAAKRALTRGDTRTSDGVPASMPHRRILARIESWNESRDGRVNHAG